MNRALLASPPVRGRGFATPFATAGRPGQADRSGWWRLPAALVLFVAVAVAWTASPAIAQENGRAVSVEELEGLVQTLEDEQERQRLVGRLRALIEVQREDEPALGPASALLAALSERVEAFGGNLVATAAVLADAPDFFGWAGGQIGDPLLRSRWIETIAKLLGLLAMGAIAERAAGAMLSPARTAVEDRRSASVLARAPLTVARLLLDAVPVAVFAAAGFGLLPLMGLDEQPRLAALMLIGAYLIARGAIVLSRALFMPDAPNLRLPPMGDETAAYLHIWARRLINVSVFGYVLIAAARLLGLPESGFTFALKVLGLVVASMVAILVLQNRQPVAAWMRRDGEGTRLGERLKSLWRRLAEVWHLLAAVYITAIYIVWALEIEGGFEYVLRGTALTAIIIAAALLLSGLVKRLIERGFAIGAEQRERFPQLQDRANRYLPVLHVILRGAVGLMALLAVLSAWGIDTLTWLTTDFGRRFAAGLISIIAVIVGALAIWEVVSSAIERYLTETDGDGRIIERSARARTLLPLLRNALMVFLVVVASLIVLAELGINIAPLLAGAGVVGLAIGFGSQKLVQDLITGAFILFEDTISVGDVVKLNEHAGLVEAISIRTIRLRDLNGNVHTIPFSGVGTIVNMTKEFSYYVMNVGVAYREDTDEVTRVLKDIGAEMQADPEYGPLIIEPLDVLGVDAFADSAVIIKARFKTAPIKQWFVGREFNRRMKKRFDELGIEIPFPHTTLYFGEDKRGKAPPMRLRVEDGAELVAAAGAAPPREG